MSDEEVVRAYIEGSYYEDTGGPLYHFETDGGIDAIGAREPTHEALDHILSDRDSLRAALERIAKIAHAGDYSDGSMLPDIEDICRQALTSSEKEKADG